jgi:hypothetical protein
LEPGKQEMKKVLGRHAADRDGEKVEFGFEL